MKMAPDHYVTVPGFFPDPVNHYRMKTLRTRQDKSGPQSEFFKFLDYMISLSADGEAEASSMLDGRLLIAGYDASFMERKETIEALKEFIRAKERYPVSPVCAIISESDGAEALGELSRRTGKVDILIRSKKIEKGYLIYPQTGSSYWDSTRSTYYPPEVNEGVIYRIAKKDSIIIPTILKGNVFSHMNFLEHEKRLREGVMEPAFA